LFNLYKTNDRLAYHGYNIYHSSFYHHIEDPSILPKFIIEIANGIENLSKINLIHCNITPDNILIQLDKDTNLPKDVKLMNFGDSLEFTN